MKIIKGQIKNPPRPSFLKGGRFGNLFIAISEKKDGSMKLLAEESLNANKNLENRKRFLDIAGINNENVVSAEIIHGNKVEIVGEKDCGKIIAGADGIITGEKDVFLSVTVADCLPVFLYEPEEQIAGILHAGWRGLEKNIICVAIEKMKKELGCRPEHVLVGIGPAICRKHFDVGEKVAEKFKDYPEAILDEGGKIFLDLKKVVGTQFINAGGKSENIEISSECVFELQDKYFSHRRDKLEEVKAMMALIGIKA